MNIENTLIESEPTIYCSGCFHGIINRIIAETFDEMGLRSHVIGINAQGCSNFIPSYLNIDFIESLPGIAPDIATGIKKVHPEKVVFTVQGDGDLLSYGLNEVIQAAVRGEKITIIMINNLVMAQSGGQMSPGTLTGQVTTTTPFGRSFERTGKKLLLAETLAKLPGVAYVSRVTTDEIFRIEAAKNSFRKAIEAQLEGHGFSFIEFITSCPTYWNKSPLESKKWLQEKIIKDLPLGTIKSFD